MKHTFEFKAGELNAHGYGLTIYEAIGALMKEIRLQTSPEVFEEPEHEITLLETCITAYDLDGSARYEDFACPEDNFTITYTYSNNVQ